MAMIVRPRARSVTRGIRSSGNALRPVEWIRACYTQVGVALAPGTARIIVSAADFDDFTRPTVVRCIGNVYVQAVEGTGNTGTVTMGITIVNPNETPPDAEAQQRGNRWMWWHCLAMNPVDPPVYGMSAWRIPFDVRSMRKRLVDGSSLQFVIVRSIDDLIDVSFSVGASTLVKE